jgi:hypothetical protein
LDWISKISREGQNVPHFALARVIIYDVAGFAFSYPIPYIFISGNIANIHRVRNRARANFINEVAAVGGIAAAFGVVGAPAPVPMPAAAAARATALINAILAAPLAPPFPPVAMAAYYLHMAQQMVGTIAAPPPINLGNICRNIGSYGVGATNPARYSHSERAVGLCLEPLLGNYLNRVVAAHNALQPNAAAAIVIQIKISRSICNNCQNFWMSNAHVNGAGNFCAPAAGAAYPINGSLNAAAGVPIPVQLRISSRPAFSSW